MLTRRTLLAATVATVGLGAGSACSPPQAGGDGDGETLTVYSNSVADGRGEWLQEQAASDGFSLQFVDLGGGDIQNRLLAEASNPIADVVFGLNNVYFEKLKAAEVLAAYTPAWSGEVDASLGDGECFWPIVREPIMLVCNDAAFPDGEGAPADWPDLWTDPAFEGRYEVPSSLGGATAQMVLSGILSRFRDDAGELGISGDGWEQLGDFFAKGSRAVQGTDLYARMASGEVDMGQMWLAGKFSREEEYGIATTAVKPEIGVPNAVQHVAQVAGTKRAETAAAFIDWFGGAEVQAAWSNEFFTAPTNEAALESANQDAVEMTDSFALQEIDWGFVAENLDGWVEKIELDVLG
ncbi:extracellular solute-binding protein, family 1 [Brachybacterium faecium]|uniref:ABC-type Fe3+ transport system, periplasmic component n=1 Tax=Brachybacterium faecium (strain ATCC 43885 / DSM 4810 / JCM 11609 / LMG 19847 / NBRC 14762 / NCIMB 9860 / 6-10) TaxID=446465 RepID=C7MHQ4_BRAFD|nr:ABC-type Fe3+ transport system, periplasmic component [Brachybacterium faecium DSM 4810]SLM95913.1 extracellular solute-binding protein, family 1 [Brachybacterium faecium]